MDLSLRLISKRTNCAPERSYCDRSALSTKASAARSLLKVGIFFFIGLNLLLVHVTGADGPDQKFIAPAPQRGDDEHAAPFICSSDRAQPPLVLRVGRVRKNGQRTGKKASIAAVETPCSPHLARLPLSQSKPVASEITLALWYAFVYTLVNRA